ncbi:MAG: hypothetical protein FWD53_10540, partial [Phycisphaerales bacterium]|nr:hypothetical protein [Phycisphaerales bacterium]
WLACNPLVLCYANDANSHATTLLCVVVGFWGLLSWMQTGKISRAWIGGLALGYACTIRYSEFLLVLPLLFAAIVQFRPNKKQVIGTLSLLVAWAIPIAILAFICWVSFGSPWKTGYTYCNESTGFGWKYFTGNFGDPMVRKVPNWETFLQQLNRTALFVLWVPALLGLLAMFGSAWRLGITIALWILPQTILYMFYYWAPGGEANVSYMRFVMTLMPGFILAAIWFLDRCKTTSRVPVVLAAGVITAVGCGMNLRNIAPQVESRHLQSTSLRQTIDMTQKLLDPGSVIFGDDQLLNLLDCVGDWKLVNVQMFSPTTFASSLRQIESANPEQENDDDSVEPHPVQRHRLKFQMELLGRQDADGKWTVKPFEELRAYQNAKLDRYFAQGRRIAFMTAGPPPTLPPRRDYELKVLGRWSPPVPVTEPTINPAMRFGRPPQQPGGQPGGRRMPPGQGGVVRAMPNRLGGSVALYELVKKAEPIPVQERMRRRAAEERGSNTGTGGGGELFPNVPAQ